MDIRLPDPEIQVLFGTYLAQARARLQPALLGAVGEVGADAIDRELRRLVPEECRTLLAGRGDTRKTPRLRRHGTGARHGCPTPSAR
jgi:hypothetical protein